MREQILEVTREFVDYAEHMWTILNSRRRQNMDALLFEWWLIQQKNIQKPNNWRQDFIYNSMMIDAKEINGKWFGIHSLHGPQTKMDQLKESIVTGELTHFLFYETDRDDTRILQVGDQVKITPFALCEAKPIWKWAYRNPSSIPGCDAYVPKENLIEHGITL